MKYKIKEMLLILAFLLSTHALKAQNKEQSDSTKKVPAEKVNVLFGMQEYERFVGNMVAVKGEKLKNYPAMMVQEALAGQLPGLFMMQNNGNPGEDNFTSYVRGNVGGFITLVDGVERPLNPYDLEQIEEIRLLKDPVSKALYGGRISNGILMVTTKRGKKMDSKFHAVIQRGVKMPTSLPEYLNSHDFANFYNQALSNDGITVGGYDQSALDAYKSHSKPFQYPDVDYYDQFLNNSMDLTRISTEYYGGSEITTFYVHGGYQKEGGFETYAPKPRQMQTFNLQGNLNSRFSDAINLHANFAGYMANKQYPGNFSLSTLSTRYPNSYPIFVTPDSIGGTPSWRDNPYGGQAQSGYIRENHVRMQADIGFNIILDNLLKGLTFNPLFSFDIYHKQNLTKVNIPGIYSISSFDSEGNPLSIIELQKKNLATSQSLGDDDYIRRWGLTGALNYQREIENHAFDADLIYYISKMAYAGELQDYKRQNLGLRINYSFKGKYSLEGVLNYCGSTSYMPNKRFKTYPALGAGWLISEEDLIKNVTFINFLKLNASWGIMGDGNITPYLWRQTWASSGTYAFNTSTTAPTTYLNQVYSSILDWPEQSEIDLSLESKMLNKIGWKLTYFDYLQSGTLSSGTNSIPQIIGGTSFLPQINFGKTGLKGIEIEISYKGNTGDFKYEIGTHLTRSRSKRIKVDELPDPNFTMVGMPYDVILGYMSTGTYSQADIDQILAGSSKLALPSYMDPKALRAGNIIYKDINNDKVLDKYDYSIIGNNSARLMYGGDLKLSYKGFDLYAMLLGFGEYKRYLSTPYYQIYSTRKYSRVLIDGLPNGNPSPRLTTGTATNDFQTSDYWIVNGGFLKLQNLSLTYTIPQRFARYLKTKDIKVSCYGTDLLSFSKIKKSDPESLDAGLDEYPLFSTYSIGLTISF